MANRYPRIGKKKAFLVNRDLLEEEFWGVYKGKQYNCWGPRDWQNLNGSQDFLLDDGDLPESGIHIFEYCKRGNAVIGIHGGHRLWKRVK